jgi:predicted nucleic acid-binding protein
MRHRYVIVDTDVFSFVWQNRPEGTPYEAILQGSTPVLSFTSVAEAYYGAYTRSWGERKMRTLEAAVKPYVVVPYSVELAKLWGQLKRDARKIGHPLGHNEHSNDLWICATALLHQAPLATHNRRHFEGVANLAILSADSSDSQDGATV